MTPSMMMFILKFSLVFTQRVIWLMASGVMFASVKLPSFKLSFRLFLKHPSCWQRVRQSEPWPHGSASTRFFIPRESEESIFCWKNLRLLMLDPKKSSEPSWWWPRPPSHLQPAWGHQKCLPKMSQLDASNKQPRHFIPFYIKTLVFYRKT